MTNMYVDMFKEHQALLELLPLFILGLCLGISDYFISKQNGLQVAITKILQSGILCAIVYGILTALEVPYLFRVCTAGLVAFYGVDRTVELVKSIIATVKDAKSTKENK